MGRLHWQLLACRSRRAQGRREVGRAWRGHAVLLQQRGCAAFNLGRVEYDLHHGQTLSDSCSQRLQRGARTSRLSSSSNTTSEFSCRRKVKSKRTGCRGGGTGCT
jgi:hypothetical protein